MAAVPEILLALSGHESPIFDDAAHQDLPFINRAEAALLQPLGRLAGVHRALKLHVSRIAESDAGIVTRAVAARILSYHVASFQRAILRTEEQILNHDPSVVGAYKIVPLAAIVSSFTEWSRVLEWLWQVSCFMLSPDASPPRSTTTCTGPAIIDQLRLAMQTGYHDIEKTAADLVKVAERSWLRQLSSWLLEEHLEEREAKDFFIQRRSRYDGMSDIFSVEKHLLPAFLDSQTAASILFIGKLLGQLYSLSTTQSTSTDANLLPRSRYIQNLSSLASPISSSALSSTMNQIRSSLSQELAQGILPTQGILYTLSLLREYFLAGNGDFTDALIKEADRHLRSRHILMRAADTHTSNDLAGLMMKESEVAEVLAKTWVNLAPSLQRIETTDQGLEWARENLILGLASKSASTEAIFANQQDPVPGFALPAEFDSFLLSAPTALSLKLRSPMDIFLTASDLEVYSAVHAYLLSIRRAHMHLTDLWKESQLRKANPVPTMSSRRGHFYRPKISNANKQRYRRRAVSLRPVWAVAEVVIYFLVEIGEYMTVEVIDKSWATFYGWATKSSEDVEGSSRPASQRTGVTSLQSSMSELSLKKDGGLVGSPTFTYNEAGPSCLDPEVLSHAHRQYLVALLHSLLLVDKAFPKILSSLLRRTDQLAALINRLQSVWNNIDLQEEGVVDTFNKRDHSQEENNLFTQTEQTTKDLDLDLKHLVDHLKYINSNNPSLSQNSDVPGLTATDFEPWAGSRIDLLLFRLDSRVAVVSSLEGT